MSLPIERMLCPYQVKYLQDLSPFIVCEKSRRIGISYTEALKSVLLAAKKDKPIDTYYMSFNYSAAREWLEKDVGFWVKLLQELCEYTEEDIIDPDNHDAVRVSKITFASGGAIYALPSRPTVVRGRKGRAVIDEAAHVDNLPEMIRSAAGLKYWGGGSTTVISTHYGELNEFNILIEDVKSGKREGTLHTITLLDAVKDGIYHKVCQEQGRDWNQEDENKWVEQVFSDYAGYEGDELMCCPSRNGDVFLPRDVIQACQSDEGAVVRHSLDQSFSLLDPKEQRSRVMKWFASALAPLIRAIRGVRGSYLGVDIGRSGDLTALSILVEQSAQPRRVWCPLLIELRNCPFDVQTVLIKELIDHLPYFRKGAIDATGIGAAVAESVAYAYRPKVEEVKLSGVWHDSGWSNLRRLMESQILEIPFDLDVEKDLQAVKIINGAPRIPKDVRWRGQDGLYRHGDSAMALCLAASCVDPDKPLHSGRIPPPAWSRPAIYRHNCPFGG